MVSCLSSDALERLANAELTRPPANEEPGEQVLRAHVSGCPRCAAALEESRREAQVNARLFEELRTLVEDERPAGVETGIPGYVLLEELHRGGQGVIYRARERDSARVVALKVLNGGRRATPRERYRFEREIEIAARLDHPNIVSILESGTAEGVPWYTMELVDGEHLDRFVQQRERHAERAMPLREKLGVFLKVARAVAHAHQHGVIHRDLKPENVLITPGGEPRVLDFGIARATEAATHFPLRVTAPGEFMGTLAYAAPEQVLGRSNQVGTASDVYSLGVMLFEMLTGSLPHRRADGGRHEEPAPEAFERIDRIVNAPPPDIGALAPELDRELATLVHKALAKDPARRYPSAEALARDLERYLAGHAIEARGDSVGYLLRKAFLRHRLAFAVGLSSAALLVVVVFAWGREYLRAEQKAQTTETIQTILSDLVAAARPGRMGSEVTLIEVLQEAADTIESSLAEAPEPLAAVEFAIGDTYWRLRSSEEARRHLTVALERYRKVEPKSGLATAQTLHVLGRVHTSLASEESIPLLEEALAIRRRLLGAGHDLVAESQRALGHSLLESNFQRDPERAQALLASALYWFEENHGSTSPEVAHSLFRIGVFHASEDRFNEARKAFERALDIFSCTDTRDAVVVECMQAASRLARRERRYGEAQRLLSSSIELATAYYGERWLPGIFRIYSRLHHDRMDLEASEDFMRRALSMELRRWAKQDGLAASKLTALARALDAGEEAWLESFRAVDAYHSRTPYRLTAWMLDTAELLRDQDRVEAARDLVQEASRRSCSIYGDDCPLRLQAFESLGELLNECGDSSGACQTLEAAWEMRKRLERTDDDKAGRTRALLMDLRHRESAG